MAFSADDRSGPATALGRPERAGRGGADQGAPIALPLARAIVVVAFCCFGGVALLWVVDSGQGIGKVALAFVLLTALLSLQYFYFGRAAADRHSARTYVLLAVQACLAYLPVMVFGQAWVSQATFLAGSVLLVFPPSAAWPLFAGVVAATGASQYLVDAEWLGVVFILVNTATAGLFVYGLTRLAWLVTALHEARDELARTAVAHERLRFTRDLHALLGSSLSAIALQGELSLRLLGPDPERAGQELRRLLETARRALADVRSIARLYRGDSLGEEAGALASMLASSDVDLRVDLGHGDLPPHTRTMLGAVLREGGAFVLRHRESAHCEILLRRHGDSVVVDLLYEGVGAVPGDEVDGLADRVARMAGELTAGVDADGRSRVHITLPVTPRPPDRPADAGADAEPATSGPRAATKLAGALVVAVLSGLFVQAVLRLFYVPQVPETGEIVLSSASMLAALVLQLAYFSRPGARVRSPTGHLMLLLQAALVFTPILHYQQPWVGLIGFMAGSALLVLRPVLGWSVYGAVVAGAAAILIGFGAGNPRYIGQNTLVTLNTGLIVFGLAWMARSVRQLLAVRRELAEAALAEARLQLAQDLHDLLGLSLSAITLKSELALRLIVRDPARARTVLAEMLEISRHALADVRSVAGGYHRMSLAEECRNAETLLAAAGMDVRMDVDHADLAHEVGTVLAMVLREGVTNVLRHGKGDRCQVTIGEHEGYVRLRIVNDGAVPPARDDHRGSGIRNMSDRVAALGGVLTAALEGDGRFELSAFVPRTPGGPPVKAS
ncbi:sensor histidine kinase [Spirillospora sp. CA-255316]